MAKLPTRAELDSDLKWRLEDIYPTDEKWQEGLKKAKEYIAIIDKQKGTISSGEQLLEVLQLQDEVGQLIDRVISYSYMRRDEDNTNSKYQGYADQALSVGVEIGGAFAFLQPEILALPDGQVEQWIGEVDGLELYRHYLDNILRTKAHTLDVEQEELLAAAGELAESPRRIFSMFNNADLKFPEIKDEDGNLVELSHGRYIKFLESENRTIRKNAFDAMYTTYQTWQNTVSTMFTSVVKKTRFFSKARRYNSSLEAALDADNVKPEVYHNLIESIHDHLPLFHRYVRLRRKLLGVDELHMYDLYVPMVKEQKMPFSREKSIATVRAGLQPLGDQYLTDMEKSFTEGWIDWAENRGKTSGAYSWGTFGVHPFVLLNHQDTLDNMFTLAHELGHAMHSYYSDQNQEFVNSQYTIFVAEVASTLNESLVMHHLLQETSERNKRMYLLNHYLEQFRGTVFRQTMFAEFEMIVHDKIAQGESLTAEQLSEIYYNLNQLYFGEDIVVDELIGLEWARIPHFYRPFYVYKYATGFSAAVSLSQGILNGGDSTLSKYLNFLSSGGSDYPLNLLKKAGVDMSQPAPIVGAMQVFEQFLNELEELSEQD